MTAVDPSPCPEPLGAPPRRGDAGRFLFAVTASAYGDWLTTVGLVVLVYQLGGSAAAAGYILVRSTPRVVGPLFGGTLSDRYPPHRVLATCSAAQAAVTLGLIAAAAQHLLLAVFACVALSQILAGAARTASGALMPRLVPAAVLPRLNATYTALYTTSIFIAPSIGALLLGHGGVQLILTIDATTFAAAAAVVLTLHGGAAGPHASRAADSPRLSTVITDPMLRALIGAYWASGLVVTTVQSVLVVAAAERFGGSAHVGYLYSSVGAGGVVASLFLIAWKASVVRRNTVVAALFLEIAPLAALTTVSSLLLGCALVCISSFGGTIYQVRGSAALQQRMSGAFLGRANAVVFAASYTGMLTGGLLALVLTPPLGWATTVLVAAAAASLAVAGIVATGRLT